MPTQAQGPGQPASPSCRLLEALSPTAAKAKPGAIVLESNVECKYPVSRKLVCPLAQ